jgi:predicted DsbA family dithiol-disulfide isomerase
MKMRRPVPPPFRFDNPATDDEMLAQLAAHLGMLVLELKTDKKRDRALKKLEEEELPAALVAINKPAFLAGHILGQAMDLFAAAVADEIDREPPPWL